jgi:hypothetical protein
VPKHGRAAGLHPLNLRLPSWLPGAEKSVSPSPGAVNGYVKFFEEFVAACGLAGRKRG